MRFPKKGRQECGRELERMQSEALWSTPLDDVATALVKLPAGTDLRVEAAGAAATVRLTEDIPLGHKFSVHALAEGLRVRKYGEFIGRMTHGVDAGSWVHVHNLETCARRGPANERLWLEEGEAPRIVEVIGERRATVGESPVWDAGTGRLYWVDVRGEPAIFMHDTWTGANAEWSMPEDIGSIVLDTSGRLVAAMRSGFAMFDPRSGTVKPLFDPEPDLPGNRLNDAKCDPAGRLWSGSMNPESGLAEGSLYMVGPDLSCRRVADGFVTPNGHVWSLHGSTMYLSDTRRGYIYAYAFDPVTGEAGERRVFADLGALPGGPDGATVDAEGYLWSAQFNGGCLLRLSPSGEIDRVVHLPVSKPSSCAFGGPDHGLLYVTTATRGLGPGGLAAERHAGRVLVLDVGVRGLAPARFDLCEDR
ncbi:SMP-30/gluconolactonase/LRE family protein [Mesorhizobium sp. 1B3]|uniref:SMP-30/gluconolactonase/LRE family protein n=1 Tax=Mesorhizobium sp. 1B3 TaxID=3243599 RepID=UPI003D955351